MKCLACVFLFFILCSISGFSQEKFTNHTVKKGETISGIAKKYKIDPKAIYELNPDAGKGLVLNSVLIIPNANASKASAIENLQNQAEELQHKVLPKETLFSIAKKYKVKVQELYAMNPNLEKEGLKNGQVIIISKSNSLEDKLVEKAGTTDAKQTIDDIIVTKLEGIDYEVLPKETKYSIAKAYGITVEKLEKANPILQTEELKIGQKIIIPIKPYNPTAAVENSPKIESKELETARVLPVVASKTEVEKAVKQVENTIATADSSEYEVLPKETKYSIAKNNGITVDQLEKANPILQTEELKIGQKISIPVKANLENAVIESIAKVESKEIETPKALTVLEVKKQAAEMPKETSITEIKTVAENVSKAVANEIPTNEGFEYEVLPKETKYSIAKNNGITVDQLEKANPILQTEELKIGQKISIPVKSNNSNAVVETSTKTATKDIETPKTAAIAEVKKQVVEKSKEIAIVETEVESTTKAVETIYTTDEGILYEVLPKETKYSIAKRYGISLDRLDKANPILLSEDLKIGQKIVIPVKPYNPNGDVEIKKLETAKPVVKESENAELTEYKHEVLAKETKYGIAKEYGLTVRELEKQNPNIAKRLSVGTTLTIHSAKVLKQDNLNEVVVEEEVKPEHNSSNSVRDDAFFDRLIETASENIGVRYRSGGTTKDGFDCSGLMCVTFENNNIQLPRTSVEQSQLGFVVAKEDARKGDLIFFKTSRGSQINHVGMVVEVADGDIKFIHASSSGVMISSLKESYYEKRFAQINHVLN